MAAEPTKFVVTDNPPWYKDSQRDDRPFECAHTEGLLDQVARVMIDKTATAAEKCKAFQHKTIRQAVRDLVIRDMHVFKQKPSTSLLFALMDLVEIQGGELECMSTEDRAGMKQFMVALKNYTLFYIPSKALKSATDNRIVVPVVTSWDRSNTELELQFCDETRSMLATYKVDLSIGSAAYFMQQVLAVPSVQSLRVLETVAGDMYQFWDMSLEVPTHADALTPFFKQIQPSQVLRVEDKDRSSSAQDDGSGHGESDEAVEPMCCVLDKESADLQNSKRQGSVDCFSETDVICDLSRFTCEPPVAKTVYFRRTGRVLGQKRGNMIAVVSLRESQRDKQRLYVSTTARFCRALKYSCVKGSGELLKCCHTTINELACRDTFLTGTELHQDIIHPAVTAFNKRVSPPANNWCNDTPKHVACVIKNPIMSAIVDMAIKLMDAKIPNAFMVAELLLSSGKAADRYLQARARYADDSACRIAICKNNITNLDKQFRHDLDTLIRRASKITTVKAQKTAIKDLFRNLSASNINDTFKQWQQMIKELPLHSKDKTLAKEHTNMKVLCHNLRLYLSKINRLKKIIRTQGEDATTSTTSKSSGSPEPNRSPNSLTDPGLALASPISPSEKPWYMSMIVPDTPHLGTWVRNLGTLLQSAPWLYAEAAKREAVCSVLGLNTNALCNKYASVLKQWTFNNITVVEQLKRQCLDDTLSAALIGILDGVSNESWIRKVERAFIRKAAPDNKKADSAKTKSKRQRDADAKPAKTIKKKTPSQNVVEDFFCREASVGDECEDHAGEDDYEEYIREREELSSDDDDDDDDDDDHRKESGDDHDADDDKNLDEYDLDDDFIDDRSEYSVEESDEDTPRPAKNRKRAQRRLVKDADSDTHSELYDPEYSDENCVLAKITKRRRIAEQHDRDDTINARNKTASKSERKTKHKKDCFDRAGSSSNKTPREKKTPVRPSHTAVKKCAKPKPKAGHGSGDRKCEKRRRIYSDSDSSDEDCPAAKRSPPKLNYPKEDPVSPAADQDEDSSDFFGHIVTM